MSDAAYVRKVLAAVRECAVERDKTPAVLEGAYQRILADYCRNRLAIPRGTATLQAVDSSLEEAAQLNTFFATSFFNSAPVGAAIAAGLPPAPSVTALAYLYQELHSREELKRGGVYYTPMPAVRAAVKEALTASCATVLDPACGSGLFLIESFQELCRLRGAGSFEQKAAIMRDAVFGIDKDPRAVDVCRLLLQLTLLEQSDSGDAGSLPDMRHNIYCGDSLFDAADDCAASRALAAFAWREAFPRAQAREGFDCIVGNPPYGLKRGEQLSELENSCLKKRYEDFRTGKVNKYLAFLARGYELLAPDGRLAFIVPNAWLGIQGGTALRRHLLREGALKRLLVFKDQIFADAGVEVVICSLHKGGRLSAAEVAYVGAEGAIGAHFTLAAEECLRDEQARVPLIWSRHAPAVLQHIDELCVPMASADSLFVPSIALQAYAVGKGEPPQSFEDVRHHIHHRRNKEDEFCFPYLEGGDIGRYHISWSGGYLRYGPWLAERQKIEKFKGPRIAVREILGPCPRLFSAAYLEEPMLYNKSVLHIHPKAEAGKDGALALLAVLNSPLAAFILLMRGRKSQRRLFPKIVNDDLKAFPLPRTFADHVRPLAELALRRMQAHGAAAAALEADIAQAVYRAFAMDHALIEGLDNALAEGAALLARPSRRRAARVTAA